MNVCRLDEIVPDTGVCALVGGEQVAVFRVAEAVYAVGNRDPFSGANVLSRGIVGDLKGELVVASPVYKQHFSLASGRCIEDPAVRIPVYDARVVDGMVRVEPVVETRSTCCYCGVGCGVLVSASGSTVVGVRGDPSHPANSGRLCTKGAALHLSAAPGGRLLHPELRMTRDAPRRRATWDEALEHAAARFAACIAEHGPDSVAFYISGQLLTEDYYVFNKLAKGLIGTNNIDTNSRLCMSSSVAAYKLSLGADAPPCCYEDVDAADVILIAGSNTAFAHPVLYHRVEDNPRKRLIVVDPRATVTAQAADLHLQLKPGTDVALFNAMLHVIAAETLADEAYIRRHTEQYEALRPLIDYWTPERAAQVCELPAGKIVEAARMFGNARAALSLYCQGLNQSVNGTYKNCALINLHLATGQIGRPGAGPFSLTGQPNAMGGREVGGMANLLPAHRDLASEADRREVARFWGVPAVPAAPGKTAVEMFQALGQGSIKALWIACTNPVQSMPDGAAVRRALERAELVVVQEAFADAETCAYADVLLPAAAWAEKEGTVTNSERRISRVRAAVPPPGEARPDWQIAVDLARRLRGEALFPYRSPEEIFDEHRRTTAGRDLDIASLSYAVLERDGPQQWPYVAGTGRARLYADGVFPTSSGRARFVATDYVSPAEEPDAEYPLRLTTGRLRDQWHGMTRTGRVAKLFSHAPEAEIILHEGFADGELVRVTSRRGAVVVKARISSDVRRGDAFMPMHWDVNALTVTAFDPFSKQPELKHAAVRVERFMPAWHRAAVCADAPDLRQRLRRLLRHFDYASVSLAEGEMLCVELAAGAAPQNVEEIEALIGPLKADASEIERLRRGRAICSCFGVAQREIDAFLQTSKSLEAVQAALKCGTNCGSCLPELRRRVAAA